MRTRTMPIPRSVALYGALGLIPFWAPSAIAWARPELAAAMSAALAIYAGLILSFLGGARWAFAVARPRPSVLSVSLAMLPTLVGFGLLLAPTSVGWLRLPGLAVALAAMGAWDLRPGDPPAWYPRLRGLLTLAAVGGVVVGAFVLRSG
jgi:putative flippase GtrA